MQDGEVSETEPHRATLLVMGRHLRNRWGGVYEVLTGLLGALDPLAAEQGRSVQLLLPEHGLEMPPLQAVEARVLPRWGGSRLLWDHWTVPRYANRQAGTVLYNPGIVLPAGLRIPGIVSIHDLLYFPRPALKGRPEYLAGDAWYMRRMIRRSLKKAAGVHVPSESTRREALRLFPDLNESRLRVWPYGVERERWEPAPGDEDEWAGLRGRGLRPPYFLYPGGLSRRKNVLRLIEAFLEYRKRRPEARLVLTGGAKRTVGEAGLRAALETAEREGAVLRLGEVSHRQLRALYQHAEGLVYPSRYEGFGLPPLEAQAAGCPVICARATSLPEVVGEGGLYFDPDRTESLLEALEEVGRPGVREGLTEQGSRNVAKFPWRVMALKLLELADEFGGSSPDFGM